MNEEPAAPQIKKIAEIGEMPFQYIGEKERILQGWDQTIKKMLYLFKTDMGNWGYWDKETQQVLTCDQWKGKAALINNRWVKMSLYHRVYLIFAHEVTFTEWNKTTKKREKKTTKNAIVTIPKSANDMILEQLNSRSAESWLKFEFVKGSKGQYIK